MSTCISGKATMNDRVIRGDAMPGSCSCAKLGSAIHIGFSRLRRMGQCSAPSGERRA
jgi:hypothetical protein